MALSKEIKVLSISAESDGSVKVCEKVSVFDGEELVMDQNQCRVLRYGDDMSEESGKVAAFCDFALVAPDKDKK